MARTKKETAKQTDDQASIEERIRIAAYLDWEKRTAGNPVPDEESQKFWLEAEQRVKSGDCE